MASIIDETNGSRRIEFFDSVGRRRRVRLGKVNAKQADTFKTKIETIVHDQISGRSHDAELSRWLRDLEPRLASRFARAGLTSGTGTKARNLGTFLSEYFQTLC